MHACARALRIADAQAGSLLKNQTVPKTTADRPTAKTDASMIRCFERMRRGWTATATLSSRLRKSAAYSADGPDRTRLSESAVFSTSISSASNSSGRVLIGVHPPVEALVQNKAPATSASASERAIATTLRL